MLLSKEYLVYMVIILGECHRNPLLASRVYAQQYPNRQHFRQESFENTIQQFVVTANVQYNKRITNKRTTAQHD